ncbi:MAG: hypothetical protein QXW10_04110 [Candidatus Micrarchaeaceae archaeon]
MQQQGKNTAGKQAAALSGSLLMLLYAFYYIENLSFSNGFYSALLAVARINSTVVAKEGITNLASQAAATAFGLYIAYILLPFALAAFAVSAMLLFSKLPARLSWIALALDSAIFALIAAVLELTFGMSYLSAQSFILYIGVALVLLPSIFALHTGRRAGKPAHAKPIEISPETPFTNMLMLSNRLMSKLSGNIRILDMHFDAKALENLSRLVGGHEGSYKSLMVLAKRDRLGREFSLEYWDFIEELKRKGVAFELRVIPDELTAEQHERLIMDDSAAYKIPPLNIINKKSEHIVSVNYGEALSRFEYFWSKSTKFENTKQQGQ